jgi:hypothetical protein
MAAMRREFSSLRDAMKVLTAIVSRHEETLIRILEQITAMVSPALSTACGRLKNGSADWRSSPYK